MTPTISVVVPVYNGEHEIAACVQSILNIDYPRSDFEVIVVDNASSDRTAETARRFPVRYLLQPKRGAAAARNMGVREARSDCIAFTDSDCIVDRAWLAELVKGLAPGTACVGGMITMPAPRTDFEAYCSEFSAKSQENAMEGNAALFPYINTANALFRREVFGAVGYFDERFTWAGGEDLDFGWRVHWAGYAMRYVPGARVEHRHRSSPGQLFRGYCRYGRGWVMNVRKHPLAARALPPMLLGLGRGELHALSRALGRGVWGALFPRSRRERRFGYYRVLRHLGECCGRVAGALKG